MFTSIFGFLFIILIIILMFGISIVSSVLKAIFGLGKRTSPHTASAGAERQREARTENTNSQTVRKKIFEKDEGEYVDFEEIKDDRQ